MKKCKLWNRIHILASITSLLLLVLFLISKWVPSLLNSSDSSENTTSITYTNVVITPCGNYFWHSAGGAGGNWQSSDLASKNDERLLEEASNTGMNLGYNRIIGQYLIFHFYAYDKIISKVFHKWCISIITVLFQNFLLGTRIDQIPTLRQIDWKNSKGID